MSKYLEEIRMHLRSITDADVHDVYQGVVTNVNSNGSIDVDIDKGDVMYGIRLKVITGVNSGFILTPKKGAQVVFAAIEGGQDHQFISASEIDRVYIRTGNSLFEMNVDAVIINEGKLGGLAKIAVLKQQLTVLQANNTLLKSACSAMAVTLNALAPGISAAFEAAVAGTQPLDLSQIENLKVKQ